MRVRLAIAFLLLMPAMLQAGQLTLNTSHAPPHSTPDATGSEDLVLKEALRRIGYRLKIVHLPSRRCLVNADKGTDDGLFARIEGLEAGFPNLIMVPEPLATFEFAVFSKKEIPVDGWDSLKPYRTGIVTGWKILRRWDTVITAADGEDAPTKFAAGREQIRLVILDIIMPRRNGKEVFEEIRGIKPGCKALFISGYTADVIHKRGVLDERLEFISKPFRPQQLLKKVREVLDA